MTNIPVFRVLAMDPVRRVWTVRIVCDDCEVARREAKAIQQSGLRVRIMPAKRRVLTIRPLVISETRRFRESQAGQMLEKADALKRYKSPG